MADSKPTIATISTDLKLLQQKVDQAVGVTRWACGVVGTLLVGVLSWMALQVIQHSSEIASLKSAINAIPLKTATSLFSQALKNPIGDPGQIQAGLKAAGALLDSARLSKAKGDQAELIALVEKIAAAPETLKSFPQFWSATAALVNYRSEAYPPKQGSASLGMCIERPITTFGPDQATKKYVESLPNVPVIFEQEVTFHDCTLDLNDFDGWRRFLAKLEAGSMKSSRQFLTLLRVRVIYRGGPILPVTSILLSGCTFEFQIPSLDVPPSSGRALIEQVATAPKPPDAQVKLPPVG